MIVAEEANIGFEMALTGFSSGALGMESIPDVGELMEVRRPLPVYHPVGPVFQSTVSGQVVRLVSSLTTAAL